MRLENSSDDTGPQALNNSCSHYIRKFRILNGKQNRSQTYLYDSFLCQTVFQFGAIEASDSITDGARGIVGKKGDTAMLQLFFHLNKKFGKMIKKTWQYMLNVIPHIFSPINFCVRTVPRTLNIVRF